jgi:antitoxin component of RelBE/YafQ-DinJ toxin-antitoxin module
MNTNIHLSARVDPKLKQKIAKIAESEQLSVSRIVRDLLKEGVNTLKLGSRFQKKRRGVNTYKTEN